MAYRNNVSIAFGLTSFTVSLDSATSKEESLKTICDGEGTTPHEPAAIRQEYKCPKCLNTDRGSMKKARVEGREYIIVDADEIAKIKDEVIDGTKDTFTLTCHPVEEIRQNTIQDGSVYYLTPQASKASQAGYALMVDNLKRHPEVAFVGMWTPVSRTNLYELKLYGDTLVMEQRAETSAIKVVPVTPEAADPLHQQQMDMLLPMMTQPFDPTVYADGYRTKLADLLASKTAIEGADTGSKKKASAPAATVDLTAALNAQLAALGTQAADGSEKVA